MFDLIPIHMSFLIFSGGAEVVLRAAGGTSVPALVTIVESVLSQETSLVVQIEWSEQQLQQKSSLNVAAGSAAGSLVSPPLIGGISSVNGSPGTRCVAAYSDSLLSAPARDAGSGTGPKEANGGRVIRPMPAGLMVVNDEDFLTVASLTSPHSKVASPLASTALSPSLLSSTLSPSASSLHASSAALFARAIASVAATQARPIVGVTTTSAVELSPGRSPVALPSASSLGSKNGNSLFSSVFSGNDLHRAQSTSMPTGFAAPEALAALHRRTQSSVSDERGECSSDVENDNGDDDLVANQAESTGLRDNSANGSRLMKTDATVDDVDDDESDCDSMEPCQSTDEDDFDERDHKSSADRIRTAPPLPHRNAAFSALHLSLSSASPLKQVLDLPPRTSKLVSRLRMGNVFSSSSSTIASEAALNYRGSSSTGFDADTEDTLTRVNMNATPARATVTDADACGIRSRRTLSSHAITIGGYEPIGGGTQKNHALSPPATSAVELPVISHLASGAISSPSAGGSGGENGQLSLLALRAHSNALAAAKDGSGIKSPLPVSPPPKAQSIKSGTSKHSRASSAGSSSSNASVFNLHARLHVLRTRVSDDLSPSLRRLQRSILFALVRAL